MTEKQSAEFVQLVLLAFLFIYNALSLRNAVVVLATNTLGRGSMAKLKRLNTLRNTLSSWPFSPQNYYDDGHSVMLI